MNQVVDIKEAASQAAQTPPPPLLYEMVRSFATLARTLNLSHAVKELKSTRQTVRRHIALLEETLGNKLFLTDDRRYQLTPAAEEALPGALDILALGKLWIEGNVRHIGSMLRISIEDENGWIFHQQQQPISSVWTGDSDFLKATVTAWAKSAGELESEELAKVRPYLLVYRETPNGWICVEVGEDSFYTNWWGWANARSSVGRNLNEMPGGPEFALVMEVPFREVQATGGLRIDQVCTKMPREEGGEPISIVFQRLLMGSRFPDGSFALLVAVDRPSVMQISDLDQSFLTQMPEDATISF